MVNGDSESTTKEGDKEGAGTEKEENEGMEGGIAIFRVPFRTEK